MHKIESYEFGKMVIDGRSYTSDLILFQDRVEGGWWRREGHRLSIEDLKEIVKAKPEVLIVGTGNSGLMKIPNDTADFLQSKGVKLIAEPTKKAAELYNKLPKKEKVVAAFHLTC